MAKIRHWCITDFGCKDIEWDRLNENPLTRYSIYGHEVATETNRKHFQGYIEFHEPVRFAFIKKLLNNQIHCEERNGSRLQARDYCKKEGKYFEYGTWIKGQGARTDIYELYDMLKNGATNYELQEANPKTYARCYKALDRMRANILEHKYSNKFRKVEVEVCCGKAGSGKTRYARSHEDTYILNKSNNGNLWFDGYVGQKVLIIDDFYGWVKYSTLLRLLDGHPLQLEYKGGTTWAGWEKVIITTNDNPIKWYPNINDNDFEEMKQTLKPALKRRLTTVHLNFKWDEVAGNTRRPPDIPQDIKNLIGQFYENVPQIF